MPKRAKRLKSILAQGVMAATLLFSGSERVVAAPVDCVMFLCIPGGWPTGPECAAAKAVFIQRATPFPVLPPFQPWNCPMSGASRPDLSLPAFDFIRDIHVWEVRIYRYERGKNDDCSIGGSVTLGQYDDQGEYSRTAQPPATIPEWIMPVGLCQSGGGSSVRAVGIEWQSDEGQMGREVIHY